MVINQTDGYPDDKKPGMQIRSITIESIESADSGKAAIIADLAKGDRSTWSKNLSGKRGLQRMEKIFAVIFGITNMVEHRRIESHGTSFSFISVRVPANV